MDVTIIRAVQIALIVVNIAIFAWLIYLGRKRKKQIEYCDIDELCQFALDAEIDKKDDCILLFTKQGNRCDIITRGRKENMVKTLYSVLLNDDDIVEAIDEATKKLVEDCEEDDDNNEQKDNKEEKKDE